MGHYRKRELVRAAEDLGYLVTTTRRGHLRCRHPNGGVVIVAAINADHPNVWRNARSNLRRVANHANREI
jgi:hypothetical protein